MNEKKSNVLSILSLIFGIIGFLFSCFFIGIVPCIAALVLGIMALIKGQSKGFAIGGIATSALGVFIFMVMCFAVVLFKSGTSQETIKANAEIIEDVETDDPSDVPDEDTNEPVIDVYYVELAENYKDYLEKRVRITVPASNYYDDSIRIFDGVEHEIYIMTDTSVLNDAEYATVVGSVTNSGSRVQLEDTEIEYVGDDAPDEYLEAKTNYENEQLAIAIAKREQFIESAESVTYNDLRRYPDTYDGKPVKLTICFTTVDPDGLIFQGDMFANIAGTNDELSIYDSRAVREPRFMKGDTVTIYGEGSGLSTVKVKDGNGLFANVIDEYEIPSVKVLYTDLDKLDSVPVADPYDKSDEGREAGEKVSEALNKMLD